MSRSRRKFPLRWVGKKWSKYLERGFRSRVRQACHDVEIDFDPDRDWEEANLAHKKMGDWGTADGMIPPPDPDDTAWHHESYEKLMRK